jgi:Ca2+-binding EF-hand superfamily protein/ankyrin repeat protein
MSADDAAGAEPAGEEDDIVEFKILEPSAQVGKQSMARNQALDMLKRLSTKYIAKAPEKASQASSKKYMKGRRHSYDEEQVTGLKAVFRVFDSKNSGGIPCAMLSSVLVKLGVKPGEQDLEAAKREYDADGNGQIDFEEFLDMVQQIQDHHVQDNKIETHHYSPEQVLAFEGVFQEVDQDKSGDIDVIELTVMFEKFGIVPETGELAQMISTFDMHSKGAIGFEDFLSMMARLQAIQEGDEVKVKQLVKNQALQYSRRLSVSSKSRATGAAAGRSRFFQGGSLDESGTAAALAAKVAGGSEEDCTAARDQSLVAARVLLNKEMFDAASGTLEELQNCIERGADVNWPNPRDHNRTALLPACELCKCENAKLLVQQGADVNYCDERMIHPLYLSAGYKDPALVKVLLDAGANVNLSAASDRTSALIRACAFGNEVVAKALLDAHHDAEHGGEMNVDYQNNEGACALSMACTQGHWGCARMLVIDFKADVNILDLAGLTPLDKALQAENEEIADMLRRNGAKKGKELRAERMGIGVAPSTVAGGERRGSGGGPGGPPGRGARTGSVGGGRSGSVSSKAPIPTLALAQVAPLEEREKEGEKAADAAASPPPSLGGAEDSNKGLGSSRSKAALLVPLGEAKQLSARAERMISGSASESALLLASGDAAAKRKSSIQPLA